MARRIILLLGLIPSLLFAQDWQEARIWMPIVGGQTPTTAWVPKDDLYCAGAWYLNGAYGGDGSQSETDRTANENTLTVSFGDLIPDSSDVPSGYSGRSRDFERGETDFLYRGDGGSLDIYGADAKISIVAWVKVESGIITNNYYTIVSKYDIDNNKQYFLFAYGTDTNQFRFGFGLSSNGTGLSLVYTTTTTYTPGTWYHVAAVYNDVDMRIYVNGSLDCSPVGNSAGIYNGTANFAIGVFYSSGVPYQAFDGLIDEVAVFSRDLSAEEVAYIYNNGISGNKGGSD